MSYKTIILFLLLPLFMGCKTSQTENPNAFIRQYQINEIHHTKFQLCHRYGCQEKTSVMITYGEWKNIQGIFTPAPTDAGSERKRIATAIQELEILTGKKTGLNTDIGGTFPGAFAQGQMDCEDEAVNTNVFLLLMQNDGLFRFHSFYGIARRGFLVNGWPHMACAIEETGTKEIFIVDSWFLDHGMPVHVLPEDVWMSGWKPDHSKYEKK